MKSINAFLFSSIFVFSSLAGDWPQLLGPNRNAYVEDLSFTGNVSLKEQWKVDVGEGFGGAVISEGLVYLLDRSNDEEDVIKCLDLKTGKRVWFSRYSSEARFGFNGSRSVPTVDEQNVYTVGVLGHVHCYDKKTGKIKWGRNLNKDWNAEAPPWGFGSSALIYKNFCIVAPLSDSAGIVALDKNTGKTVWESKPFGSKPGYSSPVYYEMLGRKMIIQMSGDAIAAFNPENGEELWRWEEYSVKRAIPAPLKIGDDRLFITGGYGSGSVMLKLIKKNDAFTSEVEFTIPKTGAQIHLPIQKGQYLYANFNENDNLKKRAEKQGLTCLDLKGNIKWKTGDSPNLDRGNIIMVNKWIFAMDGQSGELILCEASPEKYVELFRKKVLDGKGGNIWAPLCYSNGLLIVRDQHEMKCFRVY